MTNTKLFRLRPIPGSRQHLHLTQQDGLPGNIIFALAAGSDGALWVATNTGACRLDERAGTVTMTTFSALDGLSLPVRDVALDAAGTSWLATGNGLFRLLTQGLSIDGVVHDPAGKPLAGVDIAVKDAPWRAVTGSNGHFTLANLPAGVHPVSLSASFVAGGPYTTALREVELTTTNQSLGSVVLVPLAARLQLPRDAHGTVLFPAIPGAAVEIAPDSMQVVAGRTPELSLTVLSRQHLPLPAPDGIMIGAAAMLYIDGVTFTVPLHLTLPNLGHLPPGQLVGLLRLDDTALRYVPTGIGRVSDDGTVIATTSGGVVQSATVLFARMLLTEQARLVAVSGNGQTATVSRPLAEPLLVAVHDGEGLGIPGVPVQFAVTRGDSTLTAAALQVTNAAGQAAMAVTLGQEAGQHQVTATVLTLPPVHFTATALAAVLQRISGNNQTAAPGTVLPAPLVVRLEDQFGRPIVGETVTARVVQDQAEFLVDQSGVGPTQSVLTDVQGEARFFLRLGAGNDDVVVTVSALNQEVSFLTIVGFSIPFGIAVEASGTLVVADTSLAAILRVDPVRGTRTVLSATRPNAANHIGSGPRFEDPKDIAVEADGQLLVLDGFDPLFGGRRAVIRVDPQSGKRTIVSHRSLILETCLEIWKFDLRRDNDVEA